jgi:hypothetical protein
MALAANTGGVSIRDISTNPHLVHDAKDQSDQVISSSSGQGSHSSDQWRIKGVFWDAQRTFQDTFVFESRPKSSFEELRKKVWKAHKPRLGATPASELIIWKVWISNPINLYYALIFYLVSISAQSSDPLVQSKRNASTISAQFNAIRSTSSRFLRY